MLCINVIYMITYVRPGRCGVELPAFVCKTPGSLRSTFNRGDRIRAWLFLFHMSELFP